MESILFIEYNPFLVRCAQYSIYGSLFVLLLSSTGRRLFFPISLKTSERERKKERKKANNPDVLSFSSLCSVIGYIGGGEGGVESDAGGTVLNCVCLQLLAL